MPAPTWQKPKRLIRRGVDPKQYASPPSRNHKPADVVKVDEGAAGDYKARHLIRWFEEGADGQIAWGTPGSFEACVRVATEHAGDQMSPGEIKGFCANRYHAVTGEWPGRHGGKKHHDG